MPTQSQSARCSLDEPSSARASLDQPSSARSSLDSDRQPLSPRWSYMFGEISCHMGQIREGEEMGFLQSKIIAACVCDQLAWLWCTKS